MNINDIDIFKDNNSKSNKSVNASKIEMKKANTPTVIFEDSDLEIIIGQWLGVLASPQNFGASTLTINRRQHEEILNKKDLSFIEIEKIVTKFGLVLKLAGFDSSETCTLDRFNKDNLSFNCHFINSNTDAKILLRFGKMIEPCPEIVIDYLNEKKTYYYIELKDKPTILKLQHYTINNSENKNSYYRFLSPFMGYITLTNDEYHLSIEIEKPESIKLDPYSHNNYAFRLKNEEQLQQYLLGLTFPLKIDEVYKKMSEISDSLGSECPSFKIEIKRKLDEENSKITDMLSLSHGQLKKIVLSKGERTIEVDSKGNWSYNSPNLTINQSDDGSINYSLKSINSDKLLDTSTPFEQYNKVSQEVEQVLKLTKTMLKGKEN